MDRSIVRFRIASTRRLADNIEKRSSAPRSPSIRHSSKVATCSRSRPSIIRAGQPCRTRAATRLRSRARRQTIAFPATTGTACSIHGQFDRNDQIGMLFVSLKAASPARARHRERGRQRSVARRGLRSAMVVRVAVTEIFRNCPRYVHRYKKSRIRIRAEGRVQNAAGGVETRRRRARRFRRRIGRAAHEGGVIARAEYENTSPAQQDRCPRLAQGPAVVSAIPPLRERPADARAPQR